MSATSGAAGDLRGTLVPRAGILGRLTDRRARTLAQIGLGAVALAVVVVAATLAAPSADATNLLARRQPPSLAHPFGTDWLGRDVLARTLVGLRLSLGIATLAASISAVVALALGAAAGALGRRVDAAVSWLIDLNLSLPHLVLMILIAFAAGRGARGLIIAVALTHWPTLTRVLRGEARRVSASDYVAVSERLGKSGWWVARRHLVRHLVPQFSVGLVLLFPHAILHEAGLSFLGFGLSPDAPAIGNILSEAMRYLPAGDWWLALLPGVALLGVVLAVDMVGGNLRTLLDPRSVHE
ncbi:MAG: ABC transporter permease [Egibacteraceae bacterium]